MKNRTNIAAKRASIAKRLARGNQPKHGRRVVEGGNVVYEVGGRTSAVCCGGLGLLSEVIDTVGLRAHIDTRLAALKVHRPYHESDHVISLAAMLLSGGQSLDDLTARRKDEGFLDALGSQRIPAATTAGDFLRRFDSQLVLDLMTAANDSRKTVWRLQSTEQRKLAVIDVDGTVVETTGECKEGMSMSYKGLWGFMPLVVTLANSREVLYVVNRPGNRPSHDGYSIWADRAITHCREDLGFAKVRLRGDTDFALTANFDRWADDKVEFVFGIDAMPNLVARAKGLDGAQWQAMPRHKTAGTGRPRARSPRVKQQVVEERGYRDLALEEEHIAEITYQPTKCARAYRLVILRKRIKQTGGQLRLDCSHEIRYFFFITNAAPEILDAAQVVEQSNERCEQENIIEQLKNGVRAMRMPAREFHANWAYMVIGALAWNLKAWTGLLLPEKLGARAILRMEFRTFLNAVILLPAQILRTGRQLVYRLLSVNRWTELLLDGTAHLKRLCHA